MKPIPKPDRVTVRSLDKIRHKRFFGHSTGDLWHKYNRAWLKRKEAVALGANPDLSGR